MRDLLDKIIAYEGGEMSDQEIINFFQELVLEEKLHGLQGHYGRTASRLVEHGYIKTKNEYEMQLVKEEE